MQYFRTQCCISQRMVAIHIASIGFVFPSQKARSLNIHQLLAEESEDKLEEYYRQKYATTSSARYETYDTGHVNCTYVQCMCKSSPHAVCR